MRVIDVLAQISLKVIDVLALLGNRCLGTYQLDQKALPFECRKSNLHYALGMSLLYHIRLLNESIPSTTAAKGQLLIKTTALDSNTQIKIASQIPTIAFEHTRPYVEKYWETVFPLLRWLITSEYKGSINVCNTGSISETVIALPV